MVYGAALTKTNYDEINLEEQMGNVMIMHGRSGALTADRTRPVS